jgi:hypothetical protein
MIEKIAPAVAEKLGYYVYLYVDPRTNRTFYVGKGKGARILAHLSQTAESRKRIALKELKKLGLEAQIEVLAHALPNEETAYRIEAAVIDLLGLGDLTNEVRGWRSIQLGRLPFNELVSYYDPKPAKVTEPALLIRINQRYRHNMSPQELYESTRGIWRLGPRRDQAKVALAVFHGTVRAVYSIESWHPAGTTAYQTRPPREVRDPERWEFVGSLAPVRVQSKYLGRSVANQFRPGQQSPTAYVNC